MKILIACEELQRVCIEFRKKGHEAYSCDIIEQTGGCEFTTDGKKHIISGERDMIIAFPPCTYLTVTRNRWR